MLTQAQAEKIVRDSVHAVAGDAEEYSAAKPLGVLNILSDLVLGGFKRKVRGKKVGVKAFDHTLAPKELDDISQDSLAGEVEDIVQQKSVPMEVNQ